MKKFLLIIISVIIASSVAFAQDTTTDENAQPSAHQQEEPPAFYTAAQQERDVHVFSENNLFGLKDMNGNIVAPANYQKIVMTGRSGWIVQKKNKFGLMDSKGKYLIEPKYRYADRILGRYIKLGSKNNFGIYNEYGESIIPPVYTSIELLYGQMFLTYKNYRYGISDFKGNVLIPNICDDIYMPAKDTLKIKYMGIWYVLNGISEESIAMPETGNPNTTEGESLKEIVTETANISGYSILTFSDYLIKIISSISPAHEETIDELILSHGVDTVGILKTFSWIPKYPITFSRNYYDHLKNPFNGPLSDTRNRLKKRGK